MGTLSTLCRCLRARPGHGVRADLAQPLLDDLEITTLLRLGKTPRHCATDNDSEHTLSGDRPSRFRGIGTDYEESRLYVPGDDLRHLNWRHLARTAQAYTKLFLDERRPGAFHVVDRRAGMRFGTHRRLKVTQAARATIVRAAAAHHQGMPVGGLIINPETTPTARWIALGMGTSLHALVEAVRAPCPTFEGAQPRLGSLLRHLFVVLPYGSQLDLFSDFHDLDTDDRPVLLALATHHRVRAFLIHDPAETRLPRAGQLSLRQTGGHHQRQIDTTDPALRRAYHRAARTHRAHITHLCREAGVALHLLASDTEDLRALLPSPQRRIQHPRTPSAVR